MQKNQRNDKPRSDKPKISLQNKQGNQQNNRPSKKKSAGAKGSTNAKSYTITGLNPIITLLESQPEKVLHMTVAESDTASERLQLALEMANKFGIKINYIDAQRFKERFQGVSQSIAAEVVLPKSLNDQNLKKWLKEELPENALLLVLDQIQDPHNLGAILRTAEGAGVDAVIISDKNTVPLNATVSKVASGAAEFIKLYRVTNINRALEQLKEAGVWIVGSTDHAEKTIYETNLNGSLALIMGSESTGMRRLTEEACDYLVKLPMEGKVNSLNVSVAAGICLYEMKRQKSL